jgi:hypothetical protein
MIWLIKCKRYGVFKPSSIAGDQEESLLRDASNNKLKKANKKRRVTVGRVINF